MAAVLAGGNGTVLSHRSAGQLWGIVPRSNAWPEVTRPRRFRARPGLVAHRGQVPEDETTVVGGIPVTGLSRTVLDLAGRSSRTRVERMLNEAEILGLTDAISIPSLLTRYPRRAGSAVVRQVFRRNVTARGVTRKKLERRFRVLLASTDLPEPQRNAHIAVRGRFFEVDCLWRAQRLVVELDGRAVHRTELAFERDREKDRLLVADGWRVTRITWLQLRDEGPAVGGGSPCDVGNGLARLRG
jgi:very-short-patch-repair endonuclease